MCLQTVHKTTVIKTKQQQNPDLPYVQTKEKYMGNELFANNTY